MTSAFLTPSVIDRFWRYTSPDPNSGCWLWTAALTSAGYSQLMVGSKREKTAKIEYAHRISYVMHRGRIPSGMQIDHKCGTRCCVNPEHLQILTIGEHRNITMDRLPEHPAKTRQKSRLRCRNGHELTGENLVFHGPTMKAYRQCLICKNEDQRARRAKKKEAASVSL